MMALTRVDDLLRCGDAERTAVVYRDDTVTYGELNDQVTRVAGGLRRLGMRRGDRVIIFLEKRIETLVAMFAVLRAGGVVVPVNPVFTPAQVAQVAADCTARVLVTSSERYRSLIAFDGFAGLPTVTDVVLVGEVSPAGGLGDQTARLAGWGMLLAAPPERLPGEGIDLDVAALFYTSGSTGSPKGVVLTHRNLLAGAQSVADYLGHTGDDVVLAVLPLSFDAGFSQVTTSLLVGARVVLMNYVLPREVVRLCARHHVTALTCVPPLWLQLTEQDWPVEATNSLRYLANTGGRLPGSALARLREIFPGAQPYLMFGLTEAFRSTYLDPAEVDRRPDSIGRAVPNAEILVLRADGSVCGAGEPGELVHRGAFVAQGYWNDPARTAERFRPFPPGADPERCERAVWSGDQVVRDEDGFLYFVGRLDEMIKTSGYRVSPTEIEEVAYASGLVHEAVAFGVSDDRLGQRVVLAVTATRALPVEVEVLGKALARDLPRYMRPHRIVVVAAIPRSGNGKFDRGELRRRLTP